MTLIPKKNNFFEDYKDGNRLGIGLNGEVRSCTHKKSGKTYAFKVIIYFFFQYFSFFVCLTSC